jgi:hypothetical protein
MPSSIVSSLFMSLVIDLSSRGVICFFYCIYNVKYNIDKGKILG